MFSAAMMAALRVVALDRALQGDYSVVNAHVQPAWPPGRVRHGGDDRLANLIVGVGIADGVERKIRDSGQEVPARHHPDDLVATHHGKAHDAARFH
jgi:hypothetical protein